ncbi:hypothetical protein E4T42_04017 [Aureobasidium subglaciale]|nr:hypothetical protein E4T42_04017 [Aureobasidium subglaciale]
MLSTSYSALWAIPALTAKVPIDRVNEFAVSSEVGTSKTSKLITLAVNMGSSTSKAAVRNSTNSTTPLNLDIHSPVQTNFPRSPGLQDLSTFHPHQNHNGVNEVVVTSFAGDEPESGITRPSPARPLIRRYSELIDPTQLDNQQVRSPSGHLLSGSSYNLRGDRPLSVRERQERIRQQMSQKRREQEMADDGGRRRNSAKSSVGSASTAKVGKRRGCLGCFGA